MNRTRSFLDKEPCTRCGELDNTLTAVDEGTFVCEKCLDDYIQCSRCMEWYEISGLDLIEYDENDQPVCWACAEQEDEEDEEE